MPDPRPSGLGMTFLVGGVLSLVVLALFLAFFPCVECPLDGRSPGNPIL